MGIEKNVETCNLLFSDLDEFSGIYDLLPTRCFISSDEILFSNPVIDTAFPIVVNVRTGNVAVLTKHRHLDVVDVSDGIVVGAKSSTTESPSIVIGKFNSKEKDLEIIFGGKNLAEYQIEGIVR